MDSSEAMYQLKFLFDQVHQTAERVEHLPERMPMHVHPASLNYPDDLRRVEGEYNRLVREGVARGLFSADELEAEGLPFQFEREQ